MFATLSPWSAHYGKHHGQRTMHFAQAMTATPEGRWRGAVARRAILRDILVLIWKWGVSVYVILLNTLLMFVTVKIIKSIRGQKDANLLFLWRSTCFPPSFRLFTKLILPFWCAKIRTFCLRGRVVSISWISAHSMQCVMLRVHEMCDMHIPCSASCCARMRCAMSTTPRALLLWGRKKITQYIWHCMFPIIKWN